MYRDGGWMMNPKSCSAELRSTPSSGANGSTRSKGLEVMIMNSVYPAPIIPMMPRTLATKSSGMALLKSATASIQPPSIQVQNRKDPSCPPQTAVILYCMGSSELECCATKATEKSSVTKL